MLSNKLSWSTKRSSKALQMDLSQDLQPLTAALTPGQRPREETNAQELSRAARTVVSDELINVERQAVAIAILQEKLQGMMEGSRDFPCELKAMRNLPGLGPSYKFSLEVRDKAE